MCSHYTALKKQEQMEKYFLARGIPLPPKSDMWPRYHGPFVRRPPEHDAGDEAVPEREAVVGRWGLISAMTKADGLDKAGKLSTFNARSETAAKSFTFGNAWRRGQHCIIPAEAIFEPDWRSGAAVATRFTRADGAPLGIAALLKQAGLAPSTSEANRLIDGGGVRVDGSVVGDKALKLGAGSYVVQVGKRKFARVTLA